MNSLPTLARAATSVLLLFLGACGADEAAAPRPMPREYAAPTAAVLPASAYTAVDLFPRAQYAFAYDINDRGTATGVADTYAFIASVGGSRARLPLGSWISSHGYAINSFDAVAGGVSVVGSTFPAVWLSPHSTPMTLNGPGFALGINDRAEAVGQMWNPRLRLTVPFYWETSSGRVVTLPGLRGYAGGTANDINNDRNIVGYVVSSPGGAMRGVLWTPNATGGFTATDLGPFSTAEGIDYGRTVAGTIGARAAWGSPSPVGTIGTFTSSAAYEVNGWQVLVGTGDQQAWVGDLAGNLTMLPTAPGSLGSEARGINNCGIVAGWVINSGPTGAVSSTATAWVPKGC